jgi:hypothetical protein
VRASVLTSSVPHVRTSEDTVGVCAQARSFADVRRVSQSLRIQTSRARELLQLRTATPPMGTGTGQHNIGLGERDRRGERNTSSSTQHRTDKVALGASQVWGTDVREKQHGQSARRVFSKQRL